jgi:hypothetical protein
VYLACADNYQEMKASLHTSGRWRFGFTQESLSGSAPRVSLPPGQNRAWEVWAAPPQALPTAIIAFRLFFLPDELAVEHTSRTGRKWRDLVWIEAAPDPQINVVSLFVTDGLPTLRFQHGPDDTLATFPLQSNRWLQVVNHIEAPTDEFRESIANGIDVARRQALEAGVTLPQKGRLLMFGQHVNGSRHIIEANLNSPPTTTR